MRFKRPSMRLTALLTMLFMGCGDAPSPVVDEAPDPPFAARRQPEPKGIPSVILIVVDTLRADHVGAYGSKEEFTPNIDSLAARSHLFENAVATSSWTRPSIAGMLTSRFPTSLGLLDKTDSLHDRAVTVQEVLGNQLDFQTFAVITNGNISAQWGFDQGFDQFVWPNLRRSYPDDFPIHVAEGVTQRVLRLIDRREEGRPFFLFALYVDPHDPYLPHPELQTEEELPGRFDGSRRELHELDRLRGTSTSADRERIKHLYAGEVRYADHWIGELLAGLNARGLQDEVMILLTADHGEGLWDHGLRGHGNDLYEESVHAPLVVHLPSMTERDATRISEPVSLADLAPTILATVGAQKPTAFQGSDLSPLMAAESRSPALDYVYAEMDHRGRNFESIRNGSWKLIRRRSEGEAPGRPAVQLFDLASDPEESRNLASHAQARSRRRLADALQQWSLAVLADAASRRLVALSELDDSTLESLRGLGYLGNAEVERAVRDRASAARPARGIAPAGLPEPTDSRIDLSTPPTMHRQVLGGLVRSSNESVFAGNRSAFVLKRQRGHEQWAVDVGIEPEDGPLPVTLEIVAEGGETTVVEIHSPGLYQLEGPLPNSAEPSRVVLELDCRRPGGGPAGAGTHGGSDLTEACIRVNRIFLR
jgi:arylsulfatase